MEGLSDKPARKPRRMLQPTKDYIRAERALFAAEVERLTAELDRCRTPCWVRAWRKIHGN